MSARAIVIASCAERKRGRDRAVRLRDVRTRHREERVRRWWRTLQRGPRDERLSARHLYQGEHWSIVRDLDRTTSLTTRVRCELWIASAGYGLVSINAPLFPYAATFATRHADSVAVTRGDGTRAQKQHQAWWRALAARVGPDASAPRSVAALAAVHPDAPVLVIGSPSYIMAMEQDLIAARQTLIDPEQLIIVSSAPPSTCGIARNWVVTSARLQPAVGGSLTSLNARIARKILCEYSARELRAERLRTNIAATIAQMPSRKPPTRKAVADVHVASFIRRELATEPTLAPSRLLTRLRASGVSCEQQRFKRIYQQVDEVLLPG